MLTCRRLIHKGVDHNSKQRMWHLSFSNNSNYLQITKRVLKKVNKRNNRTYYLMTTPQIREQINLKATITTVVVVNSYRSRKVSRIQIMTRSCLPWNMRKIWDSLLHLVSKWTQQHWRRQSRISITNKIATKRESWLPQVPNTWLICNISSNNNNNHWIQSSSIINSKISNNSNSTNHPLKETKWLLEWRTATLSFSHDDLVGNEWII